MWKCEKRRIIKKFYMKNLSILFLLLYMGFGTSSCKQNSLKMNERKLVREVLLKEHEKQEEKRLEDERLLAESMASIKFTELQNKMYDYPSSPIPMWAAGFWQLGAIPKNNGSELVLIITE